MSVNANESSDTVHDFVRAMKASRCSQRRMARQKESKEAERRQTQCFMIRTSGCGAREASRARLSAFHHGACCSEPTPQLSSRTHFLGRGIVRRYLTPNLSQSSDQIADRSSCRPGVFPKPPGSGGDEPSPAGTALAPPTVSPAGVLVRERDVALVFKHNSNVKDSFDAELCR